MPLAPARCRFRAFTTIELMIVVTIIGITSALMRPAFVRVLLLVRGNALMNDFRVFASGFAQYAHTNGAYPASFTTAGSFPATMQGLINQTQWTRKSPIGGNYTFLKDTTVATVRYRALICVTGTITFTSAQLLQIDKKFDNNNLTTGQFFTNGAALTSYYVIDQ